MSEKSNIQSLKEFAKSKNRSCHSQEYEYPLSPMMVRKFPKYKKQVYMPVNHQQSSHLVWFSDHYNMGKAAELYVFCGAFIPVDFPTKAYLNIRSRNILDRLNIFKKKGLKTGAHSFDSKVVIKTNHPQAAMKLLSKARLQREIIKALKIDLALSISVNEVEVGFVPSLKGKSHLSILNSQIWFTEKGDLDPLMNAIEEIQKYAAPSTH